MTSRISGFAARDASSLAGCRDPKIVPTPAVSDHVPPLVSIIVLNWQRPTETLRCLASLNDLVHPRLQIVVVDNESGDGSQETICEERPALFFMQTCHNLALYGATNMRIRREMNE